MQSKTTRSFALLTTIAAVLVVAPAVLAFGSGRSDDDDRGRNRGDQLLVGSNSSGGVAKLIVFDSDDPSDVKTLQVVGLTAGDRVLGVDVRPATQTLYGQGFNTGTSQNYVVQLNYDDKPAGFDGKAIFSPIGARYATTGAFFGYDFNPTVDRIRVFSEANDNKRVNPDTGVAITDGPIAYAAGDRNAGKDPNAVGAGYLPAPFGGTTTLYDIDANQDVLVTQNPANAGTLNTVGSLGVDTTDVVGFDIAEDTRSRSITRRNVAFAALQKAGEPGSRLYRVNLETGKATSVGSIGGSAPLESLAIFGDGR